ncbi:hypothetical protein HYH03_015595 [Edaphochlamys debaryana]|uniref:Uncharacterized protein n=1 Tax=Edaphochlamys debaryana TaxID=47281 RepID=A0A836BQS1_9CHLO|nr:hypothetical protein HYH03_015595 [Edaphochlamys debaryana]|eukprot:KAG2485711.1 hypothetical protein HYH03_015595 [Edaphochlamys debaryana]
MRLREEFYKNGLKWPHEGIVPGKPQEPPGCAAYIKRQEEKNAKRAARVKQISDAMAAMPKMITEYKASRRLDWEEVSAIDRLLLTPGQIKDKYVRKRLMKQN